MYLGLDVHLLSEERGCVEQVFYHLLVLLLLPRQLLPLLLKSYGVRWSSDGPQGTLPQRLLIGSTQVDTFDDGDQLGPQCSF